MQIRILKYEYLFMHACIHDVTYSYIYGHAYGSAYILQCGHDYALTKIICTYIFLRACEKAFKHSYARLYIQMTALFELCLMTEEWEDLDSPDEEDGLKLRRFYFTRKERAS